MGYSSGGRTDVKSGYDLLGKAQGMVDVMGEKAEQFFVSSGGAGRFISMQFVLR